MRDRGFGVERDVDLPDRFVRVEVAVDATERHRFLRVSELDSDQLFRLVHHLFGDARRWSRRRTRRRLGRRVCARASSGSFDAVKPAAPAPKL